jgi:hypothetical protein
METEKGSWIGDGFFVSNEGTVIHITRLREVFVLETSESFSLVYNNAGQLYICPSPYIHADLVGVWAEKEFLRSLNYDFVVFNDKTFSMPEDYIYERVLGGDGEDVLFVRNEEGEIVLEEEQVEEAEEASIITTRVDLNVYERKVFGLELSHEYQYGVYQNEDGFLFLVKYHKGSATIEQ